MRERVVRFGAGGGLVGILTEPAPGRGASDATTVVFLNSGIIHRVGASRLHVLMARRLAEEGVTSFRFDHSGIGDSEPRRDARPFVESAVLETREAMDHLERTHGASRFHLAGLCSGADVAFAVARVDERVEGLIKLDPFAYRTPAWYVRQYAPKLLSLPAWRHSIRVRLDAVARKDRRGDGRNGDAGSFVAPEYRRVFPPRREVKAGLAVLAGRHVRIFVCFTGDEAQILHRDQYARSFRGVDFAGNLEVEYVPQADHTFTHPDHQLWLAERVARWFREVRTARPG
jgi:hypothetical protein